MKTSLGTALFIFIFAPFSYAADWQFAGFTKLDKIPVYQFFDSASIERPAKDITRVWVKAIALKRLDQYSDKNDKELVEKSGKQLAFKGYPKYFRLESISRKYKTNKELANAAIDGVMAEVMANDADLQRVAQFYFEIDCKGRRLKLLDGFMFSDKGDLLPQKKSRDAAEYSYIAPDTNGDWLSQIVCVRP